LPSATTDIGTGATFINLDPCIVPTYVSSMVMDPSVGTAADTGYTISVGTNGRVTIAAPHTELTAAPDNVAVITVTR
jgi:hypothetical protein